MQQLKLKKLTLLTALLLALMAPAFADDKNELTELELDAITAGDDEAASTEDLTTFEFTKTTRAGTIISTDGSFKLVDATDRAAIAHLLLSDSAQSNLSSLININAVNSTINVLLNLNISIDSNIDSVNQYNLNGVIPALPPTPAGD